MKNMHGYQIRTLIEKMYLIQRLIVEQNWDELKKTCKIACEVEEILYEINQYPCIFFISYFSEYL